MNDIIKTLFEMQDISYRDFNSKLIPNLEKEAFIGVRTPDLKKLAKQLYGTKQGEDFLNSLPHRYFEENQLHAFLIAQEKDFEKCLQLTKDFLPYVNNWATCDQLSPKCFFKHSEKLLTDMDNWIQSGHVFTIRFGILAYMRYFLDEKFEVRYAERISEIKSDEYYVKMMIAWYFATALAKQWESIIPIIAEKRLDPWVHNKSIQKAMESFRISKAQKELLKNLRIR